MVLSLRNPQYLTPQCLIGIFIKEIRTLKLKKLSMSKVINLLKIHGSLTWELSPTEKSILRKSKSTVKNPIMVFPSSDKYAQSYQEPYFELFYKISRTIEEREYITDNFWFFFCWIIIYRG